jgi:hypothetical protein
LTCPVTRQDPPSSSSKKKQGPKKSRLIGSFLEVLLKFGRPAGYQRLQPDDLRITCRNQMQVYRSSRESIGHFRQPNFKSPLPLPSPLDSLSLLPLLHQSSLIPQSSMIFRSFVPRPPLTAISASRARGSGHHPACAVQSIVVQCTYSRLVGYLPYPPLSSLASPKITGEGVGCSG